MSLPATGLPAAALQVTATIGAWIETGAILPLAVLYVALSSSDYLLQGLLGTLVHGEWVHSSPISARTEIWIRRGAPSILLARALPAFEVDEYGFVSPGDMSSVVPVQVGVVLVVGVLSEEALARGVPLLLAQPFEGLEVVFVALGTVFWAFLHGTGRGLTLLMTNGWLLAALWLSGHWHLAVRLHLANNFSVLAVRGIRG